MSGKQLSLEDTVPNFTQESTFGKLNFYEYLGDHWGIFFAHPADFTPVCTAEIAQVSKLLPEFEKRNTKVIGLSIGSVGDHKQWIKEIEEIFCCKVNFPIVADYDRKVALLYRMIHPKASSTHTLRPLLIISPDKKLKLWMTYPIFCGRNFIEVLRSLDAIQLAHKKKIITPPGWKPGDDVIIPPEVPSEEAKKHFPEGWKEITPYYRVARFPE